MADPTRPPERPSPSVAAERPGMKPRSYEVTEGPARAPARAMLRAVGMTDDDWDKPQVGVASSWNEVTPCNLPLDRLAKRAKDGVRAAGGFPFEFVTIAVSDGISMGHEGMRASLVSREVIADSVETVMHAERFDAMVTFAGCDKSLPGMLMAAARINLPAVFLYGGSILPGRLRGPGARHRQRLRGGGGPRGRTPSATRSCSLIERNACPTEGSCAGMFTANTMASVAEALGMALPGSSSPPAVDRRRDDFAYESGRAVVGAAGGGHPAPPDHDQGGVRERHRRGHGARRLDQRRAAPAGHRPRGAGRPWSSTTSTGSAARVPHLADTKPHGRYHMVDVDRVGGVPVVMRELLEAGLLHGDCLTVTGRTVAENLAALDPPAPDGEVVHPLSDPIHADGGHRHPHRHRWPRRGRW